MTRRIEWPRPDYSRVPYWVYHDSPLYDVELERIFRGPTWSYLCLAAEIPKTGDFITTSMGDIPVVVNRESDGQIHAFVNRCGHRGAIVRRETHGNAADHTCIYHRWCFSRKGDLVGIPFQRGVRGQGGVSTDFAKSQHGLRKLRVAVYRDIVFGTLHPDTEPIEAYLGELLRDHLASFMHKPVEVLGYQRQAIDGNWKFYNENLRDTYHASLLHEFLVTFGLDRATQRGGVKMDARHRHNLTFAVAGSDSNAEATEAYRAHQLDADKLSLRAPELLKFHPEFPDERSLSISSMFPNVAFQRLNNSLATRQIQLKGVDRFVLVWTFFGYTDDTPEMRAHRLRQMNLLGPAGFVSMEDAEAIEIAHKASGADRSAHAVIEMGGAGEISDRDYRVTDVSVRGFWSYYAELMGMEPEGAVR
jgi:anthranilate 1,2-dioxygenase large subunit